MQRVSGGLVHHLTLVAPGGKLAPPASRFRASPCQLGIEPRVTDKLFTQAHVTGTRAYSTTTRIAMEANGMTVDQRKRMPNVSQFAVAMAHQEPPITSKMS